MSRTVAIFRRLDSTTGDFDNLSNNERLEEPDPSVVSVDPGSDETVVCQQHVVFSSTFRVPAFYFTLCNSGGAPLPLPDIVKSSLFKSIACDDGFEVSSYAISLPTSTFPLLSHGDHPTLGSPCWYFHPCETSAALKELLAEVKEDDWDETATLVRQLELWFMVLCSVVNL
ncbi:hypothetical protein P691DRAFT_804615 [Macrolepiota fuliginosa MF-IS2]|uniref:Ubiquitin-like-conjugating enzyme ATG10 n=1 Tax=Macrolepiota fuliginosa MF-IS2 TaxID=1400762 RepID=A0A9P5XJC7_9AGAR|nr:hypothetical protein P691DRAFT_804615 [Macrolepiota fuliginosa MF-IS2]